MTRVRIKVFSEAVRGGPKLVAESTVDEDLAHDELRDLLHSVGVERPERAILEGPFVWDGGLTHQISWTVDEVEEEVQ